MHRENTTKYTVLIFVWKNKNIDVIGEVQGAQIIQRIWMKIARITIKNNMNNTHINVFTIDFRMNEQGTVTNVKSIYKKASIQKSLGLVTKKWNKRTVRHMSELLGRQVANFLVKQNYDFILVIFFKGKIVPITAAIRGIMRAKLPVGFILAKQDAAHGGCRLSKPKRR